MRIIRWHELVEVPWKNGGGTTREIWRHPATGDFDWRVSVAEVASPGPFSLFPHYDRFIMPLTSHGMQLTKAGELFQDLAPLVPFEFAGEVPLSAELPHGPVTDFNYIVHRGAGGGRLSLHNINAGDAMALPGSVQLLFVISGRLQAGTETLHKHDSLLPLAATGLRVTGTGVLACCHLSQADQP